MLLGNPVGPGTGVIGGGDGMTSEAEVAARSGQRECGEGVYLNIGEWDLDFAPVTRYVMQGAGVCTCGGENDVGGDAIDGADPVDCPIGKVLVGIEAVVVRHSVELDMNVGAEWIQVDCGRVYLPKENGHAVGAFCFACGAFQNHVGLGNGGVAEIG